MLRLNRRVPRSFLTAILAAVGLCAHAQTITLTTSNAAGTSWETVGAAPNFTWSDQSAAHAGADYEVGANLLLRSPASGSPTFPGNSLALRGQFNLNAGSNS